MWRFLLRHQAALLPDHGHRRLGSRSAPITSTAAPAASPRRSSDEKLSGSCELIEPGRTPMVCSAHPLDNAVIEEFSIMSISPLGRRTFLTTSALLGLGGPWTMTSARADIAVDADLVIHESRSEEHTSELQSRG